MDENELARSLGRLEGAMDGVKTWQKYTMGILTLILAAVLGSPYLTSRKVDVKISDLRDAVVKEVVLSVSGEFKAALVEQVAAEIVKGLKEPKGILTDTPPKTAPGEKAKSG